MKNMCESYPEANVFNVTYFKDSQCRSSFPSTFIPFGPALTTGILGKCSVQLAEGSSYVGLMTVQLPNALQTTVYNSLNCSGPSLMTYESKLDGTCNRITMRIQSVDVERFYLVTRVSTANNTNPANSTRVSLVGQVDLNAVASDQNARIAGASVGVLCGFTLLLILVSMFLDL
jgi:hypothetical protein